MNLSLPVKSLLAASALIFCGTITTPALAAYDLEVQQVGTPTTAIVGESMTFDIVLKNNGPDVSEACDLIFETSGITQWRQFDEPTYSDNVPEDISYGWSQAMGNVTYTFFNLPPLAAGESLSVHVPARSHESGTLETTARIVPVAGSQSEDTNPENNQAVVTTTIVDALVDLGVTYHTSTDYVQGNSLLVVDYYITNHGPDDCPEARFSIKKSPIAGSGERLDDLELLSIVDAPGWTFEEDQVYMGGSLASIMSGRYSPLAAGASTTVTALYLVWPDGQSGLALHRHAEVSSSYGTDNNNTNDRAFFQIPYGEVDTDLEIIRSVPTEVNVNQPFTYTVQALNRGPNPVSKSYIGSIVPPNFSVVSVLADKGTASAVDNYVSLENANLEIGETANLYVTVTPSVPGEAAVVSGVVSDGFDTNLGNNHAADVIRIGNIGPQPGPCIDAPDLVSQVTQVKRVGKFKKKHNEWEFTVTARAEIRNIGTATAPKSPVWFYLSTDNALDPTDILIGGKNVNSIKPGKQRSTKLKTKLPLGMNPVGCYVIAVADGENIVAECDETNNWSVSY